MCLFRKIKIGGKAYSAEQVREIWAKTTRRITDLEESERRLYEEKKSLQEKCESVERELHKLRCANGTLRAENMRLRAELGDFPTRASSGRYAKRDRKDSAAAQTAEPQVEPSNAE